METTMMAETTKALYVRLPAELHRRLKIASVHEERPMSELVADALVRYLEEEGTDG